MLMAVSAHLQDALTLEMSMSICKMNCEPELWLFSTGKTGQLGRAVAERA